MIEKTRSRAAEFYFTGTCLVRAVWGRGFQKFRFSSGISGARSLNEDIRIQCDTNDSAINHSSLPLGRKQSFTSSSWGSLLKRVISVATAWQWPLTGPCLPSIGCATMALAAPLQYASHALSNETSVKVNFSVACRSLADDFLSLASG
jgi:hypothetical protein